MDKVLLPLLKKLSDNFRHAVFSDLDLLTFEGGGDRLSWNVSNELPFYAL